MEQGIHEIPIEHYHSSEGISKTGLRLLARSPKHYWAAYLDPNRVPERKTEAQAIGVAAHYAILEPAIFKELYFKAPNNDGRTKEFKEAKKWVEGAGKTIIKPADYERIMAMQGEVSLHPVAAELLADGTAEQSIYWKPDGYKAFAKSRPDWITPAGTLVELKTAEDARAFKFSRAAYEFGYHMQAAMAVDGFYTVTNLPPLSFAFIVVESKAPHGVKVYRASDDFIAQGRQEYMELFHLYNECLKTGEFPGYDEAEEVLDLPEYAVKAWQARSGRAAEL